MLFLHTNKWCLCYLHKTNSCFIFPHTHETFMAKHWREMCVFWPHAGYLCGIVYYAISKLCFLGSGGKYPNVAGLRSVIYFAYFRTALHSNNFKVVELIMVAKYSLNPKWLHLQTPVVLLIWILLNMKTHSSVLFMTKFWCLRCLLIAPYVSLVASCIWVISMFLKI